MLRKLINKFRRKQSAGQQKQCSPAGRFSGGFKRDEKLLRDTLRDCGDINYKEIQIPAMGGRRALLVGVSGLIDTDILSRDIINKLISPQMQSVDSVTELISVGEIEVVQCATEAVGKVLVGKVGILVDKCPGMFVIEIANWPGRAIAEPIQERLIRGSREGFTEVIHVSLSLVRRRLPDPSLKVVMLEVGRRSKTKVAVLYIEDVCNLDTVKELEGRIKAIDIDGLLEPGALSELITERTISPFPLFLSTERPDKVVGALLQGKVGIISDGSPFAMIVPASAADFFQVPEDYYMHPLFAFMGRALRGMGIILGTTLVAAFTAVLSFHYEMIPENIVIFIAETRQGVPFTPLTEALLLEFAVELMREASIRLPGPIGPTLGIVGALILGQAAVSARLVSPVMLIVVAISFMAGSIIPNYEAALVIRWIRFPIILAAGLL